MPVQPLVLANSARYSCASTPTDDAFTRSGRSLVTKTTFRPSAMRFFAIAKILESFEPSRKNPDGNFERSEWFNSTDNEPPSSLILIG